MNPATKPAETQARRAAPKRPCPSCGKTVDWSEQPSYRPFCSKRCRLIDLGEWASDSYRIPSREPAPDDGIGLPDSDYQ